MVVTGWLGEQGPWNWKTLGVTYCASSDLLGSFFFASRVVYHRFDELVSRDGDVCQEITNDLDVTHLVSHVSTSPRSSSHWEYRREGKFDERVSK